VLLTFATYASGFLDTTSRLPVLRLGRWVVGMGAALLVIDAAIVHSVSLKLYLPYGLLSVLRRPDLPDGLRPTRYCNAQPRPWCASHVSHHAGWA
jgi:hypothetical protein